MIILIIIIIDLCHLLFWLMNTEISPSYGAVMYNTICTEWTVNSQRPRQLRACGPCTNHHNDWVHWTQIWNLQGNIRRGNMYSVQMGTDCLSDRKQPFTVYRPERRFVYCKSWQRQNAEILFSDMRPLWRHGNGEMMWGCAFEVIIVVWRCWNRVVKALTPLWLHIS